MMLSQHRPTGTFLIPSLIWALVHPSLTPVLSVTKVQMQIVKQLLLQHLLLHSRTENLLGIVRMCIIQSNPIQSNLFKSGNKAHTDTQYTIYTVEIKPKIKPTEPTEPNKTHIHLTFRKLSHYHD